MSSIEHDIPAMFSKDDQSYQRKRGTGPNGDQWSHHPHIKRVESHLFQAKHLLLRASMKALRSKTPKSCSQHRNSTGLSNLAF